MNDVLAQPFNIDCLTPVDRSTDIPRSIRQALKRERSSVPVTLIFDVSDQRATPECLKVVILSKLVTLFQRAAKILFPQIVLGFRFLNICSFLKVFLDFKVQSL